MVAVVMREPRPGTAATKPDLLCPGATLTVIGLTSSEAGASLAAVRWTNPGDKTKTLDAASMQVVALRELPFTEEGEGAPRELDVGAARAAIGSVLPQPPSPGSPAYLYTTEGTGGASGVEDGVLKRIRANQEALQQAVAGLQVAGSGQVAANVLSRSLGINAKTRHTPTPLATARAIFPQAAHQLKSVEHDTGLAHALLLVAHVVGAAVLKRESSSPGAEPASGGTPTAGAQAVGGGVGVPTPAAAAGASPAVGRAKRKRAVKAKVQKEEEEDEEGEEAGVGARGRAAAAASPARPSPAAATSAATTSAAAQPLLMQQLYAATAAQQLQKQAQQAQQQAQQQGQQGQQQAQQGQQQGGGWGHLAFPANALSFAEAAAPPSVPAALPWVFSGVLPIVGNAPQVQAPPSVASPAHSASPTPSPSAATAASPGAPPAPPQQQQQQQQQQPPAAPEQMQSCQQYHQPYIMNLQYQSYLNSMMRQPGFGAQGASSSGGGAEQHAGVPWLGWGTGLGVDLGAGTATALAAHMGVGAPLNAHAVQQAQQEEQQGQQAQAGQQAGEQAQQQGEQQGFDLSQFLASPAGSPAVLPPGEETAAGVEASPMDVPAAEAAAQAAAFPQPQGAGSRHL